MSVEKPYDLTKYFEQHKEVKLLYDSKGNLCLRLNYLFDHLSGEDAIEWVKDCIRFCVADEQAQDLLMDALIERLSDSNGDWWCSSDINQRIKFLNKLQAKVLYEIPWRTALSMFSEIAKRLEKIRQHQHLMTVLYERDRPLYNACQEVFEKQRIPEFWYRTTDDPLNDQIKETIEEEIRTALKPYLDKLGVDDTEYEESVVFNLDKKIEEIVNAKTNVG